MNDFLDRKNCVKKLKRICSTQSRCFKCPLKDIIIGHGCNFDEMNDSEIYDIYNKYYLGQNSGLSFMPLQLTVPGMQNVREPYTTAEKIEILEKELKKLKERKETEKIAVKIGGDYRHFKGGKAHVLNIARHSETEEILVIYECKGCKGSDHKDGIYARPIEMFLSEVDREKYPDVKQKYRFELIEE